MSVDINIDTRQIEAALRQLAHIPGGFELAVYPAINESVRGVKGLLADYLASDVPLPSRLTKKALTVKNLSMSAGTTTATLRIRSKKIPLIHYDVQPRTPTSVAGASSQDRPDFTYSLRRGDRRPGRNLRSDGSVPFIAQMSSGHLGVFYRKGRKIKELYGPTVQYHVATPEIEQQFEDKVNEIFPAVLATHVDRVLAEHGAGS